MSGSGAVRSATLLVTAQHSVLLPGQVRPKRALPVAHLRQHPLVALRVSSGEHGAVHTTKANDCESHSD